MHSFLHKSILRQFVLVLACLLTLVLVLSAFGYSAFYRLMTKSATVYAQDTAERFASEVQYTIRRADSIFVNLVFDSNICDMLVSPFSEKTPKYIKSLMVQFSSYSLMNEDIFDIALVSPAMSWSNYFDTATLQRMSGELENTYGIHCFGLCTSPLTLYRRTGEVRLVFGHNVYGTQDDPYYGKLLGSILLSLDLSKSPITLPVSDGLGTWFILADKNKNFFSFNCPPEKCTDILTGLNLSDTGGSQDTAGCRVYTSRVEGTDLYVLSALDKKDLSRDVNRTMTVFAAVVTAVIAVLALLMALLLKSVVTPLHQLDEYLICIRDSDPAQRRSPPEPDGCEEVRNLNRSFGELLERQTQLTRELHRTTVTLYETELGRRQAELDFLRSQINPHFLYNALECISSAAAERGVPEIGDAVGALGKLFRYNVHGGETALLREELETVRAYLTVQQLRFSNRLNVIFSVRENTLNLPVMKLLVQPLVENAVHHGLEPKAGDGTLYIGTRIEKDRLVVSVYDDGVGIGPVELERLKKLLADAAAEPDLSHAHIGLQNVVRRVQLCCGPGYGLQLESEPGGGTRQILTLPTAYGKEVFPC